MPYKHNADRSHTYDKRRNKVTNCPECKAALRRRGDFTIWFAE